LRRVRSLSPEEAELWGRVASTIRPLSRTKLASEAAEKPNKFARPKTTSPVIRPAAVAPARRIPLSERTLDGSWDKRLRGGAIVPDRLIDLHGMTLDTAWAAIDRGLEQAIAQRDRVILLITGHHRHGEPPIQRGRIRAAVHDWLAASRHASHIAAVRGAHQRHGGGGSLYLILKRPQRR
jgi:DNA-nicking Smr family endonuclease